MLDSLRSRRSFSKAIDGARFMRAVLLALCLTPAVQGQSDESDVDPGRRLFGASCARCHGVGGTGSQDGPPLTSPRLEQAPDDETLRRVIREGIARTDMPGTRHLNDLEVSQIATYVRSLGEIRAEPLRGDADRGETLFWDEARCHECHIVGGRGRSLGPELTRVGARRGAAYIGEHVSDPTSAVPEEFLMIRATTRNGEEVSGMRVNEDSFSIQLRDEGNRYHSFRKSDLASLERLPRSTFMPRYERILEAADIDDLVAYLAILRGPE